MDSLYDTDALAWSEQQADLLRRLAAGERLNEVVDWANVIEEVGDVGLSQLHACESLLEQALAHLLKGRAWPSSRSVGHWMDEADAFLGDAGRRFSPSMRQRIDLDRLYARALGRVRRATDRTGAPRELPPALPFTLQELLAADITKLRAKLATDATPPS